MYDREGLLGLADIIELKGIVKAHRGEAGAAAFFEVAEGIRAMADDPDLPPLAMTIPQSGPYKALADLAVALVSKHLTVSEYVEAAAVWLGRDAASQKARDLCHMKQTATA